eukprot:9708139-Ditylum_brightwellii.AAC.1
MLSIVCTSTCPEPCLDKDSSATSMFFSLISLSTACFKQKVSPRGGSANSGKLDMETPRTGYQLSEYLVIRRLCSCGQDVEPAALSA